VHNRHQCFGHAGRVGKADPTDNPLDYHRVVEVARVPVLVSGGGKAEDFAILRRTEQLIGQGVAGIVYGRNVIQWRQTKLAGSLFESFEVFA
jgi:DhnA family fructose-bisphosphate aldolase class Ia